LSYLIYNALEYVAEIFSTLVSTNRKSLEETEKKLKEDIPEHMHTMLEKQDKNESVQIYKSRKAKQHVIVPPTCSRMYTNKGMCVT
jgi:hypothetical protein